METYLNEDIIRITIKGRVFCPPEIVSDEIHFRTLSMCGGDVGLPIIYKGNSPESVFYKLGVKDRPILVFGQMRSDGKDFMEIWAEDIFFLDKGASDAE